MKIRIPIHVRENPQTIMRRAGYATFNDPNTGITSFTKRLNQRGDFYPRFHVYAEQEDNQWVLNMHLDQKKPSYTGSHAHNADYDGPVVSREAERIEHVIATFNQQPTTPTQPEVRRSFLRSWFSAK